MDVMPHRCRALVVDAVDVEVDELALHLPPPPEHHSDPNRAGVQEVVLTSVSFSSSGFTSRTEAMLTGETLIVALPDAVLHSSAPDMANSSLSCSSRR